jgi:hypothetical protein
MEPSDSRTEEDVAAQRDVVPSLSPDAIARVRRRIENGHYASGAVTKAVARRLLERGDI